MVNYPKGFTLIELLITMSVIMMLVSLTAVSYRNFNERAKLESESKLLVSTVNLSKKKILAGEVPPTCTNLTLYRLSKLSDTSYRLSAVCLGVTPTPSLFPIFDHTVLSPLKIESFNADINFKPFGQGIDAAQCIILKHTKTLRCKKVTVEVSGNVESADEMDCACP